jgi:hypothetical protein
MVPSLAVLDEYRKLLVLNLKCKVNHIRRQTNRVTHKLTQTTHFIASLQMFHYCPHYIKLIILNEIY